MDVINLPSHLLRNVAQNGSNIGLEALAGWLLLSANFGSSMLRDASINQISKFWRVGYNKTKEILAYGTRIGIYKYSKRLKRSTSVLSPHDTTDEALVKLNRQGLAIKDLVAVKLRNNVSTPIKFGVYDTKTGSAGKYLFIIPNDDKRLADTLSQLAGATKRQSIRLVVKLLKVVCLLMLDKNQCNYDSLPNRRYEEAMRGTKKPNMTESKECIRIDAALNTDERLTENYIRSYNIGTSLETLSEKLGSKLFSKSAIYRIKKFGMSINALKRKKVILCVRDFSNFEPEIFIDKSKIETTKSETTGLAALFQAQVEDGMRELARYQQICEKLDVYSVSGQVSYNGEFENRMWEGKTTGDEQKWFVKLSDVIKPTCRLFGRKDKFDSWV